MTQTMTTPKIETKEFRIRPELLEQIIIEKLYALSIIDDDTEVLSLDLGIDIDTLLDKDGMFAFDAELMRT